MMPYNTSSARHSSLAENSGADTVLAAFDPDTYPIIAQHWFGLEPPCPISPIPVEALSSLRRHRQFEHLHRLGPRATEELVIEVVNGADLDRALAAYQRLTPGMLQATGGDRFAPAPIYEVS